MNNNNKIPVFNPYEGFIRGSLFIDLYNTYKDNTPYNINPMNEQADMLTYIDELTFACNDLNQYLDIHPKNENAIKLYNKYREENNKIINEYEKKYGPILLNSNSLSNNPWNWIDMPWPWEE
jgi:spore coat protein JB